MLNDVFHKHHTDVDHHTYGNGNTGKGDNVGVDPQETHDNKSKQYRQGQ
jgi:hypothetical protein